MEKIQIVYNDSCRVCKFKDLELFLSLHDMPMPDGHIKPDQNFTKEFKHDLNIYRCPSCGLVQTQVDFIFTDYYSDYNYTVSQSQFVKKFMEELSVFVWDKYNLKKGCKIIEIGSSDGEQLSYFKKLGANVLGFEPSKILSEIAIKRGIPTISSFFDENSLNKIPKKMKPTDVFLLSYTFDHLTNPMEFLNNVKKIIGKDKGIIVIEVHDLNKILQRNEVALFCHEHPCYYNEKIISNVFNLTGFKLIKSNMLPEEDCRGNSLIVVGSLKESNYATSIQNNLSINFTEDEYDMMINFSKKMKQGHAKLKAHVRKIRNRNKRVVGYGAAGRGVFTLLVAGLTKNDLEYVADKNPYLHNKLLPGSHIPVVSAEQLLEDTEGLEEIIVFNYGYIKEIRNYYKKFISKGGKVTSVLEYIN